MNTLHRNGASFNAVNDCGMTPLLTAAANDIYGNWVRAVAEVETSVSAIDNKGRTVLHWIATNANMTRLLKTQADIHEFLDFMWSLAGAALELRDTLGRTPLLIAASYLNEEMIRAMLEREAAVVVPMPHAPTQWPPKLPDSLPSYCDDVL